MDEPESLDTEMTELQECSYEALESLSQDDEDEVEELQNSLREVVQDQSVKPKLQCLMVDPSFSMVTVQSEDSGIVWETASSRCSTPWASETSSVSEGNGMEGTGAAGKITIIFDEEKVVRRRTRSGRSSRLSDKYSRPGSSRTASALGVERLEMMEVSQPNVKQDKSETEPDLEEIKNKDQQLFSLISEGYEILNIRVPSKLPTVDEEESTELQDNLSYLDQTPKIKSNNHQWAPVEEEDEQDTPLQNEESKEAAVDPGESHHKPVSTDGTADIDYFEKFTLLDAVSPDEKTIEEQDECVTPVPTPEPEQITKDTGKTISPSASEESFVFVSDEDIVPEHLDEVFYGEGPPADLVQHSDDDAKDSRMRRQSSVKESGSVLFESEETVLTPIYISSGPPKIIDPILLEEPTAMSFMYSDLYEDAMGERSKSDEECSETESITSEKSYQRCLTDDYEEVDSGYLEKFILKDETPNVEVPSEATKDKNEGRMMWSQNDFEMSGCLTRVVNEEDTEETEGVVVKEISTSSLSPEELETTGPAPDEKEEIPEVIEEKHTEIEKPLRESPQTVEAVPEVEISEIPKEESVVEQSTSEEQQPIDKVELTDEVFVDVIDTPAPAVDVPPTAIEEEAQVSESIVDAVIKDSDLEIPKELIADSCLEVSADCEPPVQANVEIIEKGGADIQTQVCIDLQELDVPSPAEESTLTVEGQEGEKSLNEAEMELEQKQLEMVNQEEVSCEEAATDTTAGLVKEMVSVDGELLLLVPKGQAVEMDIEISPKPAVSPADQGVDQTDIEEKAEVVMEPEREIESKIEEKTVATEEIVDLPEKESEQKVELEEQEIVPSVLQIDIPVTVQEPISDVEKTEEENKSSIDIQAGVNETVLPMDESPKQKPDLEEPICLPVQEISVPTPETITEIETAPQLQEKEDEVIMTDVNNKEDVATVLKEELKETEQNIDLEKHEIVSSVEAEQSREEIVSSAPSSIPQIDVPVTVQESISDAQKTEKDDKANIDVQAGVNETALLLDESRKAEQKPDLEEPFCLPAEGLSVPAPETITEIQIAPQQLQEEQVETVMTDENDKEEVTTVLKEELKETEQNIDLEKHEIVSSVPSSIPQIEMPDTVEEPIHEMQKPEDDEPNVDIQAGVNETVLSMDEGHKAVQEPDIITADVTVKENVLTEECSEAEHTFDEFEFVSEMKTTEGETDIVSDKVEMPPTVKEEQTASLEGQVMASVTQQVEAETEELSYDIVNKQECQESQDVGSETPKVEPYQCVEMINRELEEDIENKDDAVEEQTLEGDIEEDINVRSTLKRFTPLQDLSELQAVDVNVDISDNDMNENALDLDDQMDVTVDTQDVSMQEEVVQEKKVSPDVAMEYEIITKQDTTEVAQVEMEEDKAAVEDEHMEEVQEEAVDTVEGMEVDYETIDAEEERQARLAAELEGLDWYCLTCGSLLSEEECSSASHQGHDLSAVDQAYEQIMEKLSDWISELQGKSENIEDLVSELELAYNSVEDQFHASESEMQVQNEEMMALVMEQYNSMSVNMEEEKKAKLEQLYDQIVSFQESIDSAKGTLETTAREAETDARSPEEIRVRLKEALESAMSLELGPKGLLVFEDYAKGNPSNSQLAQRKGIAVPQRPTLQVQEPGSATSSSVTVYWKVNPEDVIDCFQVYCMEDPQGAISEEYRVTVKESYCVLEELEADKTYKVWVMAVNYTGCSLPSARLIFKTAPSVPVIDTERCTVIWDTAVLRWSSVQQSPGLSYTLEYCRQYELEGEGLRTISGIKNFEHKVLLQPNENYLFYIKAVSEAGSSEQSEAALISTKGTKFHLLKATAHPALELSVDQTTLHYSHDILDNMPEKAYPFILGEQLPVRGHYYWENDVSRCTDYRLGVAYKSAPRDSPLGEGPLSWCLQCTPTESGYSYHLVHNGIHSTLFVIDIPERVGIFLDYQFDRLSFYNAQSGQLLGSFSEHFTQPCHAALGIDAPGSVEVCMVQEVPEFTKDS